MKLSHIHEDKTPFPFPSVGKTLADYLNSNRIYVNAFHDRPAGNEDREARYHPEYEGDPRTQDMSPFDIQLEINDRPINLTKNGPFKTVRYELVEYEPEPESANPLDNIRDEYGGEFEMFAAVVEGANKFEGQLAWYNQDLISGDNIPRRMLSGDLRPRGSSFTPETVHWEEGRPPKFPRRYKR